MSEAYNKFDKETAYIGAIDLGSYNCRLLIAEKNDGRLTIVDSLSKPVSLGEGVARTGKLSSKAMDRAITALTQCLKKLNQYQPIYFEAIATEACRRAVNQTQFLKRVQREVGLTLRVINSEEEARFVLLGCRDLITPETKFALIFDIGGGSTEVLWASLEGGFPGKLVDSISIPHGVVSLAEIFKNDTRSNYNSTCSQIEKMAQTFCEANQIRQISTQSKVQLIGTSGTTTTAAALKLGLHFYDRTKVDGIILTFEEVQKIAKHVQMMTPEERLLHPCLSFNKDDLILGGMAILEGLYRAWSEMALTVTDRGVRDGMVYALSTQSLQRIPS